MGFGGMWKVADVGEGCKLAGRWLDCGRLGGGGAGAPDCRTLFDLVGIDSIDDLGGVSSSLDALALPVPALLSILACPLRGGGAGTGFFPPAPVVAASVSPTLSPFASRGGGICASVSLSGLLARVGSGGRGFESLGALC